MNPLDRNKRTLLMYVIGRKDKKPRLVENIPLDKEHPSTYEGQHNGREYYLMRLYDTGKIHTQVIALDRVMTTRTEKEAASLGLLRQGV